MGSMQQQTTLPKEGAHISMDGNVPHVHVCVCVGVLNLFTAWEPTKIEIQLLHENPKRRKVNGSSTIGLTSSLSLCLSVCLCLCLWQCRFV